MNPKDRPGTRGPGRPPLKAGELTISKGVRLLAADWALVAKVARTKGSRSTSAGLRKIIRFYRLYHPEHQIMEG